MKKSINALILVASAALACGCTKTPGCSDSETVNLVKQILTNAIHDSVAQDKANLSGIVSGITQQQGTTPNEKTPGSTFLDNLANNISGAFQVTVETIRVSSHDEKIGKYSCDAEIVVKLPPNLMKVAEDIKNQKIETGNMLLSSAILGFKWAEKLRDADNLKGDTIKHDIHYTSQLTEGKDQQLVELQGHQPVAELISALGAIDAMRDESAKTNAAASHKRKLEQFSVPENKSARELAGKQPSEIFEIQPYGSKLKQLLGDKLEIFENNLSVGDEIKDAGDYYVGTGCLQHSCGVSEAAFAISKPDQSIYAVIMENGAFQYFGATAQTLPLPLQVWVKAKEEK